VVNTNLILSRTVSKLLQIIGQICAFEAPFGGLGATYAVHLRLIGKLVGYFLLVIIELFSLGAFVLSQFTRLTDRRTDGQTLIGKLVGYFLLVIIELFSLGAFVLSQFTRLTDRRTDIRTDGQTLIGRTAVHTMQRGKNICRYAGLWHLLRITCS